MAEKFKSARERESRDIPGNWKKRQGEDEVSLSCTSPFLLSCHTTCTYIHSPSFTFLTFHFWPDTEERKPQRGRGCMCHVPGNRHFLMMDSLLREAQNTSCRDHFARANQSLLLGNPWSPLSGWVGWHGQNGLSPPVPSSVWTRKRNMRREHPVLRGRGAHKEQEPDLLPSAK